MLDDGERGQPPLMLSLNDDAFHSIGLYVRQGHYAVTRSDLSGNIKERVSRQTDALIEPILDDIARLIETSPSPILGVGHAVPALVGEDGTLFEVTPTQAALPLSELAEKIGARFRLPVYWDNGTYCAAAFEAHRPRTDHRCLFYISLDFGIGGGLVTKGAVFRGAFNRPRISARSFPKPVPGPTFPISPALSAVRWNSFRRISSRLCFWRAMPASSTGSTTAARGCRSRSRPSSSSSIPTPSSSAVSSRAKCWSGCARGSISAPSTWPAAGR